MEQLLLNDRSFCIVRLQDEQPNVNELIYAIQLNRTVRSVFLYDTFLVALGMHERRRLLRAVGGLPKLESFVYLSDSKKVRIPVDALADLVKNAHRLAIIELNAPNLVGKEVDFLNLCSGLQNLRDLKKFKLLPVFFEQGQVNLDPLFDALSRIETLEDIKVSLKCEKGSKLSSYMLKYLCRLEGLRVLDLRWSYFTDNHVETIARELKDTTSLTDLTIGGQNLGPKSTMAIANMIELNDGICRLCLASKGLSNDSCCNALWKAIDSNPYMKEIVLENTDMFVPSHKSAKTMANVLADNDAIVTLRLFNMGLNGVSTTMLAQALQGNTALKELDLGKGNERIGNQGYEALAKMLEQNYTLERLHTNASGSIREHLEMCLKLNQSAHKFHGQYIPSRHNSPNKRLFRNPLHQFTICK